MKHLKSLNRKAKRIEGLVSSMAAAEAKQAAGDPLAEAVRLWALWSTAADPLPPLKP